MIKRYFLLVVIILSFVASFILPASIAAEPVNGNPAARLIVTFDEPARQAVKDYMQGKGQVMRDFAIIPAMAISLGSEQVPGLMSIKGVRRVGIDGKVYKSETELDNSWGVNRIGAGNVHNSNNKGSGIKIAIIDTGIDYTHPDLDANYAGGYDFVNNDNDPIDDDGHGTHVSGIVAAEDNGSGVVGVAPEADLYALKVLDSSGSGYWSDIMAAIEWSVINKIQVINMSLGANSDAPGLHDEVIAAYNAGIVIIAAAGNSGNPRGKNDTIEYPARYPEVIAVGATDQNNIRASFSSTGSLLELTAPGVGIRSTIPNGNYASYSGTSMASPHVAGTAALIIASGISINNEVRLILQNTADDLGTTGKDSQYGYGLVNAYKAVAPPIAAGNIQGTVTISGTATPIPGALVAVGTKTATTDTNGSYTIAGIVPGAYDVTASAMGYQSFTQPVSVTSGATSIVNFGLNPATQATTVSVISILNSTEGGKDGTAHLKVITTLKDEFGSSVVGAIVNINIELNGVLYKSFTGTTATDGTASFKINNAPSGAYKVTVTNVSATGLVWSGGLIESTFNK